MNLNDHRHRLEGNLSLGTRPHEPSKSLADVSRISYDMCVASTREHHQKEPRDNGVRLRFATGLINNFTFKLRP